MPTQTAVKDTAAKPFSIENFRELFAKSPAAKALSEAEREQVNRAIGDNDTKLLQKLYNILWAEDDNNKKMMRDFIEYKDRVIDEFAITARGIEKKYIEYPRRKKAAREAARERRQAEQLLNKI